MAALYQAQRVGGVAVYDSQTSAGGGFTLALDAGSYTYTGQVVGLAYSGSTGFVTIKAGSWLRYRVI